MATALLGFLFSIVHGIFLIWFSTPLEGSVSIGGFILFVVFVAYSINKLFSMVRSENNDTIVGYEESGISNGKYYSKSGRKVISRRH